VTIARAVASAAEPVTAEVAATEATPSIVAQADTTIQPAPADASAQPLLLIKRQAETDLLGRDGGLARSGLGGLQSGNPVRMVTAITAAAGR
jgi:hypothetical protein